MKYRNSKILSLRTQNARIVLSRGLAAIAVVLLSVGGFLSLRDSGHTQPQPLIAAVEADRSESTSTPQYLSKDIRDLQVMQDRVLADNPLEDETEAPLGEIVPAEWRVVRLEHTEPNGTRHIIERGMPLDEIELEDIRPDATIFVDLPEHGVSADFTVQKISPCPTPNPGDGCLVTTKFIHENAEILDLRIDGSNELIGTTASHPFWSEDRQQFVAAGDLRVGENLLLANDTTRRVESLTRSENRETVYNIEVDGQHVYYVGHDGVLVHNTCSSTTLGNNLMGGGRGAGWIMRRLGYQAHHIVAENSKHFKKLRDFLKRNGIDAATDASNGVWLPGPRIKSQYPRSSLHRGRGLGQSLHGKGAAQKIGDRLRKLDGDEFAIRSELEAIGREIQDGVF